MRNGIFGWDLPPGCSANDIEQHASGGIEDRIDEYLEAPNVCLYCESEALNGSIRLFGGNKMRQEVECDNCGECWTEVYTLTDVEVDQ